MIPFDENTMTIIMGLGGPDEPGPHGPMKAPGPDSDTVGFITKIRDMCDEYLMKCGKCCNDGAGDLPAAFDGSDASDVE